MNLPTAYTEGEQGAFDIPFSAYRDANAVNHGTLYRMHPTPAHCYAHITRNREEPEEETPAMILGSLIHQVILEPTKPLLRIAVKPADMKFSTKEGKQWRAEREAAGMVIVPESDWKSLGGVIRAATENSFIRDTMHGAQTEVSLFAKIGDGLMRKARVDIVPAGNFLADIKTLDDASKEAFKKYLADRGYARQAAWYRRIWNHLFPGDRRDKFVFFAMEKDPPYATAIYQVSEEVLDRADDANEAMFAEFERCVNTGEWPAYPAEPQFVSLPPWVKSL